MPELRFKEGGGHRQAGRAVMTLTAVLLILSLMEVLFLTYNQRRRQEVLSLQARF